MGVGSWWDLVAAVAPVLAVAVAFAVAGTGACAEMMVLSAGGQCSHYRRLHDTRIKSSFFPKEVTSTFDLSFWDLEVSMFLSIIPI